VHPSVPSRLRRNTLVALAAAVSGANRGSGSVIILSSSFFRRPGSARVGQTAVMGQVRMPLKFNLRVRLGIAVFPM